MTVLFCPLNGIIRAVAFGSQSRRGGEKRALVPFAQGRAELHYDPVHRRWRIQNIEAGGWEAFTEDLGRFYTASLWAEIFIKIPEHASREDPETLYQFYSKALAYLKTAGSGEIVPINLLFLWRFLGLMGVSPDIRHCYHCEKRFGEGALPVYQNSQNVFLCPDCRHRRTGEGIPVSRRQFEILLMLEGKKLTPLRNEFRENPENFLPVKRILFLLTQSFLGFRLKVIQSAGEFL